MKIEGFDGLMKKMKQVEDALGDLDGEIAQVEFDPQDPISIEKAIEELNAAVDQRIAGFSHNNWVTEIANGLKERGRSHILERAAAARLKGDEDK